MEARCRARHPANVGSFFFFSFVGRIIVFVFLLFFIKEMLSGSVHLDHRMSVKISRTISPLGCAALWRKRSADCLHSVAHHIGNHQKSLFVSCRQPSLLSSTHPSIIPLSSFGFFLSLAVAGDLRVCMRGVCMHCCRPVGPAEVKGHVLPANTHHCVSCETTVLNLTIGCLNSSRVT